MSRTARILVAEFIGTMILILGGPGTVIFAQFIGVNVGVLGVAIAFGLSLLCAAYLFGHISGCHINPAVTLAMWALKRTPSKEVPAYLIAQILGALFGGFLIWLIVDTGDTGTTAGATRCWPTARSGSRPVALRVISGKGGAPRGIGTHRDVGEPKCACRAVSPTGKTRVFSCSRRWWLSRGVWGS